MPTLRTEKKKLVGDAHPTNFDKAFFPEQFA
jgi:hypothetical protein